MILSANKKKISENPPLPNVQGVIDSFLQPVRVGFVTKQIVRGKQQEVTVWKTVRGMRQAMSERLAVMKEGERSWRWHVFYFSPDVVLATDDEIVFQNTKFRIMEKTDWAQYGYLQYNAIESYGTSVTE